MQEVIDTESDWIIGAMVGNDERMR